MSGTAGCDLIWHQNLRWMSRTPVALHAPAQTPVCCNGPPRPHPIACRQATDTTGIPRQGCSRTLAALDRAQGKEGRRVLGQGRRGYRWSGQRLHPHPRPGACLFGRGLEWGRSPVRVTILGWAADCCIPCSTLNAADFYIVVSPMTDFNIPGESLNFTGKASVTISNSSLGEVGWGRSEPRRARTSQPPTPCSPAALRGRPQPGMPTRIWACCARTNASSHPDTTIILPTPAPDAGAVPGKGRHPGGNAYAWSDCSQGG